MKNFISLILSLSLVLFFVSCAKKQAFKTVTEDTKLVENPGEKKPVYTQNGTLKRGEYVIPVKDSEEKSIDGKKYQMVQIDGVTTKGWIEAAKTRDGKLTSVTIIKDSDLFIRPNEKADKSGKVKAGQIAFKLEEKDNFILINLPGKEGYIQKSNIGDASLVVKTVTIPNLGKATVTASSQFIASEGKEASYDPRNVFDGSLQTAWCEGKTGDDGVGESVTITFDTPVSLNNISIVNGHTASENSYKNNNRVASIKLTSDMGSNAILELKDEMMDYQPNAVEMVSGRSFTFTINGVHKGKVSDTCLSEIKLEGMPGAPDMNPYGGR